MKQDIPWEVGDELQKYNSSLRQKISLIQVQNMLNQSSYNVIYEMIVIYIHQVRSSRVKEQPHVECVTRETCVGVP